METLMNMTIGQIIGGATGVLLVLSTLIEITPIKWNPLSSFLGWLGRKMNHELMGKVNDLDGKVSILEDDVTKLEDANNERNAVMCRVRILRFGDEIRRGIQQSKDSFDQVLSDMDEYDAYCDIHRGFKNNKTAVTQQKIRDEYARCLEENDFL